MDAKIIKLLKSPETGNALALVIIEREGDDIVTGRLVDVKTGFWFRLENGIADLTPIILRNEVRHGAFCAKYGLDSNAGLVSQRGPLTMADLNAYVSQIAFFREYNKEYEADVVESPFYKIFDEATLGIWTRKKLKAGDLVTEIGCGSGRQTLPMAQVGCKVIGVDLSEEMLLVARKKLLNAGQKANFIVASADRLPLTDGYADAAVIFGSLHHFPDPELSVAEAARLVKSGGSFYMVEPHNSLLRPVFEFAMRLSPLWKEEAADEPLFSAKQWNSWFWRNGFKAKISYSTILPPHLLYLTGHVFGIWLLKTSDMLVNLIPGVKRLCGVIVADAFKIQVAGSALDTTSGASDIL